MTIKACPECDSTRLRKITGRRGGPSRHWCDGCSTHVNDPIEREAHRETDLHGLARKLSDMDPDDVGGASA